MVEEFVMVNVAPSTYFNMRREKDSVQSESESRELLIEGTYDYDYD